MAKIDLHIHSNASDDGEFTAKEIIGMCERDNVRVVSITDHNSVKSVEEAILEGKEHQISVLSGIEIDCVHEDINFHLLGYGFQYDKPEFEQLEKDIYRQEMNAAEEKISKFKNQTGIKLTEQEVFDLAKGAIVTGELIAEIVLNREDAQEYEMLRPYLKGGIKSDMPYVNFYWDYFSKGKLAYVPINYITVNEAKEMIQQNKGIAVLAHPGQNLKNNYSFVDKIISLGIDGIEVFSSYHNQDEIDYFYGKACDNHLIATCGSDFHGKNKPTIKIGDCNLTIGEEKIIQNVLRFC